MSRSRRSARRGLALLAVVLAAAGCGGGEPVTPADGVARVGSTELSYDEFSLYVVRQVGETGGALASDVLSGLLDRFLDEHLLALYAADRGLVPEGAASAAAVDALMAALADEDLAVSASEIEAYYEAHREEFRRPERVRLRQALFDDRATAESARREIRLGAAFSEVAERLARDSSAAGGGGNTLQGELAREELPPSFGEVIFRLEPGEVSEVVEAEYGFHLFSVSERLPAAVLPLERARTEIRDRLERERADLRLAEMVAEARRQYNVTVFVRNLPFNYQGRYLAHSA